MVKVMVMKMEIVMVKMMVTIVMMVMVIVQEEKLHPDPAMHEKWRRYV